MTERLREICSLIVRLKPNTSNLVLQKLLYFIQAASLVYLNHPAFEENIEAWQYGPVVPEAYKIFKYNKNYFTKELEKTDENIELFELIEEIVSNLGEKAPFDLVDLTHSYFSWIDAWNSPYSSNISNESILRCHLEIAEQKDGFIF